MSDAESDSDDSLHEFLALSRIIPTPDANLTYDPKIAFLLQQTRKPFQLSRKQKKIVKTSIAERKRSESCKLSYHAPSLAANISCCTPPMHNLRYKNSVSLRMKTMPQSCPCMERHKEPKMVTNQASAKPQSSPPMPIRKDPVRLLSIHLGL